MKKLCLKIKHLTLFLVVLMAKLFVNEFRSLLFPGPALMNSHQAMLWLCTAYATLETLTVHSGFHLPFLKSPEFHDFHHLKYRKIV